MLKRILGAGASAMVLAMSSLPAGAALPHGWYVSLQGGANFLEDTSVTVAPPGFTGTIEPDTGWVVMGAVGYRWDTNWRVEFELAYRANDFDASGANTGEVTQFSQMFNAIYEIPLTSHTALGLGAGLGGTLVSFDVDTQPFSFDDDYVLTGQLIAQLTHRVSRRLELFIDYRYSVADQPEHDFTTPLNRVASYDVDNHAVMIGLRHDLTEDQEQVAYLPPPPPPPPARVEPKQYIVFFGFNKWNLTRQAQQTVAQAAMSAKSGGSASILVVGHTDTSGSDRYNQKLSERRANVVANELVRNGIEPAMISAVGKGEQELLVQTGDGAREPQNRRVEVNL